MEHSICVGGGIGKSICSGDSGGPLVSFDRKTDSYVLLGVVSGTLNDCGYRPYYGSWMTSVPLFVDWIRLKVENF